MPAVPLFDLLKTELGARLAPGAETFLDLFAEDAALECPFAPPDSMQRVVGKKRIAAYLARIKDRLGSDGMTLLATYPAIDPDVIILEHVGVASNQRTGERYAFPTPVSRQLGSGRFDDPELRPRLFNISGP